MKLSLGIYNLIDNDLINESINRVVKSGVDFYTYTSPKGLKCLRVKISEFINDAWKYKINDSNILITSGSQQSINLIAYSLLNDGDTVFLEQPTYYGAVDVFKKRNINLVGVDLTEDGFDLDLLENKIKKYSPKMIYVTPTYNNPTGYSWSNNKRVEFLKLINKYNILVIEDDPYSYINLDGEYYKSLYELNDGKNIIYLGTFSKLISPSINIGYIITDLDVVNKLYSYKKSFDLCTSTFLQYVILDYLTNNNLLDLINKKIPMYKALLDKSIIYLKENYTEEIEFITSSKGGLFYLVRFKDKVDENIFENLNDYYIDGSHENETRINICSFS